jgi:prophage maintenance system killer protein
VTADYPFLLSVTRLREIHAQALEAHGGRAGEREGPECIESVAGGARTALDYHDAPIAETGAVYACYLLRNAVSRHCMVDGNKRLGWFALVDCLLALGLTVDVADDEAERFVCDQVVGKHCTIDVIMAWLTPKLRSIDD